MRRSAVLAALASTALVAGTFSTAVAASAPSEPSPPGSASSSDVGPPEGDRDGDRVSDDFEAELAAAAPSKRFDVIVEGLRPGRAREVVGAIDVSFDLPIIDGFSATMAAAQVRGLLRVPGLSRISQDGLVRALDDAGNRDFGVEAARADNVGSTGAALDGRGIGVCVVDTGVRPDHEQLSGRIAGFFDAVNGSTAPYDDHGHGTHVAGIALGDGTAAPGASGAAQATAARAQGVAPAASLYAAKVLNGQGTGSDSQVLAGVQWCVQKKVDATGPGVRVISMSLGDTAVSDGTDPLSNAVNEAVTKHGLAVVVAAGNSGDLPGTVNSPGVAENAITVGAVSDWSAATSASSDTGIWLAAFSSRGPVYRTNALKPDVSAPGVSVLSATPTSSSSYESWSGTSMATPFVAGAAALSLQADPATTPQDLKAAMMATAEDRGPDGTDNDWGAGLVDVRALVDAVEDAGAPVATTVRTAFPTRKTLIGSVGPHGSEDVTFYVPPEGVGVPLALTLTITSGGVPCDVWCQVFGILIGEWSPDLDMELFDPNGNSVAVSQCTLDGLSCGSGRQETIGARPAIEGWYRLRVYEWTGGSAIGGDFHADVSHGPRTEGVAPLEPDHKAADGPTGDGGSGGGGDPDPTNQLPIADAGADQTVTLNRKGANFTLDGSGSSDPDGTIVSYSWSGDGLLSTSGALVNGTLTSEGTYTFTLTVTDDRGDSDSATVEVTAVKSTKGGGGGGGKPPRG